MFSGRVSRVAVRLRVPNKLSAAGYHDHPGQRASTFSTCPCVPVLHGMIAYSRCASDARRVSKSGPVPYVVSLSFRSRADGTTGTSYARVITMRCHTGARANGRHARRRRTPRPTWPLSGRAPYGRFKKKECTYPLSPPGGAYRFLCVHAATHLPRRITYAARRFTCPEDRSHTQRYHRQQGKRPTNSRRSSPRLVFIRRVRCFIMSTARDL